MKRVTARLMGRNGIGRPGHGRTGMGSLVAAVLLAATASSLTAQEPVQREHVVRDGDTLWDLAAFYYSDPFTWPTIYEANTTVVEDPHWIYPEEVLIIPGIMGDTEPEVRVAQQPSRPLRTVFYRPPPQRPSNGDNNPTVLSEPSFADVPVRPGEYNAAPWVGDPDDLEPLGRFIRALRQNRAVGGAPSAHPQDRVFLAYTSMDRPRVGQELLLVHVGDRVRGARGRILQPTGVVTIQSLEEDVMVGQISNQYGEIYRGQVAIPMPLYPDFMVEEAQPLENEGGFDLEGELLELMDDPPLPSRTDIGFVNLGAEDGVMVGDLFTAYLPERASRDRDPGEFAAYIERLPPENVAVLRVVRVSDDVATVKIDQVLLPRLAPGTLVRRTHRVQ